MTAPIPIDGVVSAIDDNWPALEGVASTENPSPELLADFVADALPVPDERLVPEIFTMDHAYKFEFEN